MIRHAAAVPVSLLPIPMIVSALWALLIATIGGTPLPASG
jgi:hypothetical protein